MIAMSDWNKDRARNLSDSDRVQFMKFENQIERIASDGNRQI